jgi:hypothetical protein
MKMNKCNYINHHLFKLNKIEKGTFNYFTYSDVPVCQNCNQNKYVKYVVKNNKSKTLKNVSYITGNLIYNPYGTHCRQNQHFYCKKCDKYF